MFINYWGESGFGESGPDSLSLGHPPFLGKMAKNGLFFEGGGFLGVIFFSHNMLTFAYQKFLQKCDVKSLGGGGALLF